MKYPSSILAALALMQFCLTANATDVDVAGFINSALQRKGVMVTKTRTVEIYQEVCDNSGFHHLRSCQNIGHPETQTYTDNARVTSGNVASASAIAFDNAAMTTLPTQLLSQRQDYVNCGQDPMQLGQTLLVSGTSNASISKSQTISSSMTISMSDSATVSAGIGSATSNIGFSFTAGISDQNSKSEGQSQTVARTWTLNMSVPPGHHGFAELWAFQSNVTIPFSATVVVDGPLEPNVSGSTLASQLLSVSDRTMPYSGVVTAGNVSQSFTGNYTPPGNIDCTLPSLAGVQTTTTTSNAPIPTSVASTDLKAKLSKLFVMQSPTLNPQRTYPVAPEKAAAHVAAFAAIARLGLVGQGAIGGPTIGPPDGTSYTITSSTTITRMDAACGFNDLGVPNGATYLEEVRHYETYSAGQLVASWDQTADTFQACSPAP